MKKILIPASAAVLLVILSCCNNYVPATPVVTVTAVYSYSHWGPPCGGEQMTYKQVDNSYTQSHECTTSGGGISTIAITETDFNNYVYSANFKSNPAVYEIPMPSYAVAGSVKCYELDPPGGGSYVVCETADGIITTRVYTQPPGVTDTNFAFRMISYARY